MSYAIRNDGKGWRAINSAADVGADEAFSAAPPAPTQEQITALYELALDNFLDDVAKSYRYGDRTRLALRAGYPNGHQSLAIAFGTWMDQCNDQAKQLYVDVLAGNTPMPTIEAFIASLPAFALP